MKPAMGEIQRMSPPSMKGVDSDPGGHPEAENVPPPGTHALSNGDDAGAATRLAMSPLKVSAANEGRPTMQHPKAPASPSLAACALRRPVLILRRLDPKKMRRSSDIRQMGLNKACAKRIRRELARGKRNCRRRYLRKMGRTSGRKAPRKAGEHSPRGPRLKGQRSAGEASSGDHFMDGALAGDAFTSLSKRRSQVMQQLGVLPQPLYWSSHNFQPLANSSPKGLINAAAASLPTLSSQSLSSTHEGHLRPLIHVGEQVPRMKEENHTRTQQLWKWYESAATPQGVPSNTVLFPSSPVPHQRFPPHPGGPYQENRTPHSAEQGRPSTLQSVINPRVVVQPTREVIVAGPSIGIPMPPPLIPMPRVDVLEDSHSRDILYTAQASRWAAYEPLNPSALTPRTTEPPHNGHYFDHTADAYSPSENQRRTVFAVKMDTTDSAQKPMVLIPALTQRVHSSAPVIQQVPTHHSPPPSLPTTVASEKRGPSNAIWIVGGQQASQLPVSSVSQPSTPLFQRYLSPLPSAVSSTSQHISSGPRQESPQDLSLAPSSVIARPPASSSNSPTLKQEIVESSLPVSSSRLSLLLTAGVPLVPVSSPKTIATVAHNTVTTITKAPVTSAVPIGTNMASSSILKEDAEDETLISYETKKSKAVRSKKQKYWEYDQTLNVRLKKIKMMMSEEEMENILSCHNEDPLSISSNASVPTVPTQESCPTPTVQPQVSVVNETVVSGEQLEAKSKANYVAVISTITAATTVTVITTATTTATVTTTAAATTLTDTSTSQSSISTSVTSRLFISPRAEERTEDNLPCVTSTPSPKESSLLRVTSEQEDSTKTPFILVPKKRLRVLLEHQDSPTKGTPVSVVKQLSGVGEVLKDGEAQAMPSIIDTTFETLKDRQNRLESSGQSMEENQGKEAQASTSLESKTAIIWNPHVITTTTTTGEPTEGGDRATFATKNTQSRSGESAQTVEEPKGKEAPPLPTALASSPSDSKMAIIWRPHAIATTTITPGEPTERGESDTFLPETLDSPLPVASRIPLTVKKEQLKKLVVQVERLAEKSFTDAFLATHNVSASCAARLCRHLRVLRGAGQYHRPLNRKAFLVRKVLPAFKLPPVPKQPPSPEIPRPPRKAPAAPKWPSTPRIRTPSSTSQHSTDLFGTSSSHPSQSQSPTGPTPPMPPAKISEAAGIITINSLKRRRLMVFRNKRLQPSQLNQLLDLGLALAKKASRNSILDSMGARGTLLDPGYFGIKGSARPSQRQASQESQDSLTPIVSQSVPRPRKTTKKRAPRQTRPIVPLQDDSAYLLQQQQQFLGQIPPDRVSVRTVVPPPALRAVMGPHPPSGTVLVQTAGHNQGTRLVMVDQQGQLRERLAHGIPPGYSRYPVMPSNPESWTNRPQVSRDTLAPPLMFMGPIGMGAVAREHIQQLGAQTMVARPPPSRAVPPPLSFMGHSTDTNSWTGPQHGQPSARPSWPRVADHSLGGYPVINHTKHVVPEKASQPTYLKPPPPYRPRSTNSIHKLVFQGQPHPHATMTATPRPNPSNHQLALEWQGNAASQSNPHPQEHPLRVITTAVCHPPLVSTDQPGMTQQAAAASGVGQRLTSVVSQVVADPGSIAASSTTTTAAPIISTGNVDSHQCHATWLPEVMAVVEALLLQLVDAGLPTRESFIVHTVKQLLHARPAVMASAPFCCTAQEKHWYQVFYNTHSQRFKAQEAAKEPVSAFSQTEVKEWLMRLKVEMIKFYGVPPQRIFYMHELNFFLDQQTREVKYHRMFPGLPVLSPGSKDTVSVLFTLGADGQVGPGMIIFPRMVIPKQLFESLRSVAGGRDWVLGSSANGWLTQDCVLEFVSDVFVPWLRRRAVHFPTALFSSEYISGMSVGPAAERFMAQGVHLISVPRQVAGVLSPAEWILGYHLRWQWGRIVKEWTDAHANKPLLEENFAPFIISFLTAQANPTKVSAKFSKFGICPFDPQAMYHFLLKYHSMSKVVRSKQQNRS